VGRGDGDDDAHLANLKAPDAVDDGYLLNRPAGVDLVADLSQDRLGHLRIGLVFQAAHLAPLLVPRTTPVKVTTEPTAGLIARRLTSSSEIGWAVISKSLSSILASTDRREEGHLVTVVQPGV